MATKYPLFLNAAQRAHYSKRRKEIWEALHPEPSVDYGREDGGEAETEVAQVAPPQFAGQLGGARPQTKGFAAATAEVTGESKRAINLNVARAEAIGDDLLRLGPMWAGVGVKNAWGVADVQRPFNGRWCRWFCDGDETQSGPFSNSFDY